MSRVSSRQLIMYFLEHKKIKHFRQALGVFNVLFRIIFFLFFKKRALLAQCPWPTSAKCYTFSAFSEQHFCVMVMNGPRPAKFPALPMLIRLHFWNASSITFSNIRRQSNSPFAFLILPMLLGMNDK